VTDFEVVEGIAAAAGDWDELADRAGASPFLRPGWFEAWSAAFGGRREPVVVCGRRDGRLVAALPALRGPGILRGPTNWHTPVYGPVVEDEAAAGDLAGALLGLAPSFLDLGFLDPAAPFAAQLRALVAGSGRRTIERPVLRSPYVALDGDYEAFEATLEAKFRREANRRRRKLEEQGEVEVTFADGRERLGALLDEGFAVEGSGWKTDRGTAIAQNQEVDRFYRDVAAWAAERGWLQLGFVRLDGRAIAFNYSLVAAGTVYVVKVGFDPDWRRYAPGTILTREAIRCAYEAGCAVYDFLGDEDRYKLDWTSAARERIRLQVFGRTALGMAELAAWRYGRPTAKRVLDSLRERRTTD
jgi:CelD/BcsL family acetyltransferase involved in cellulose biosynthesis